MIFMRGKLFLIIGPSGVGKGTAIDIIKAKHPEFVYPLSATTRDKREDETDGEVYQFMSKSEFKDKIKAGEFLEYAKVHNDNYYGTLRLPIIDALDHGKIVIREVDIQGLVSIRQILSKDKYISIFVSPKDFDQLKTRITHRSKIPDEELQRRIQSATKEISRSGLCDYHLKTKEGYPEELAEQILQIIYKGY